MGAAMMDVLTRLADIADALEVAAERDETNEPAYVLVIEAKGILMQGLQRARAETQALGAGISTAERQ